LTAAGDYDLIRIDMLPVPEGPGDTRQADLADASDARAALGGAELVVHCAAIHPWKEYTDAEYLRCNIAGTWQVYAAAAETGIQRVVLTSSIAAGGYAHSPADWPIDEQAQSTSAELYSVTKYTQEWIARHFADYHGIGTIALRPPAFMPKPTLETGALLLGAFALVEDIAAAHVLAVQAEAMPSRFEAFYTVNPLPYGPADADVAGDPWALAERYHPGVQGWFAARGLQGVTPWVPVVWSIEKARQLLGWQPHYDFDRWWAEHAA
jgi:nucleoside-diphosphate-sugar epimerase